MLTALRARFTYANVMATIAVFVALGGSSYAAVALTKNSIKSKHIGKGQIKRSDIARNAVNSGKVANNSLLAADFKAGELPAGSQGPKGDKGDKGDPGPLVTTLPSGATLRGMYAWAGRKTTGYSPVWPLSYQFPLASSPTINVIGIGGASTAACPGTVADPQAAPGNLCVYQQRNDGTLAFQVLNEVQGGRYGAVLYAPIADNTNYEYEGTWAVTAP